jgi:hypothetical protein
LKDALDEVETVVEAYSEAQYDGEQLLRQIDPLPIKLPEAKLNQHEPEPLFTTGDDYQTATRKLIMRKKLYEDKSD